MGIWKSGNSWKEKDEEPERKSLLRVPGVWWGGIENKTKGLC